jgi:hypothetical protein
MALFGSACTQTPPPAEFDRDGQKFRIPGEQRPLFDKERPDWAQVTIDLSDERSFILGFINFHEKSYIEKRFDDWIPMTGGKSPSGIHDETPYRIFSYKDKKFMCNDLSFPAFNCGYNFFYKKRNWYIKFTERDIHQLDVYLAEAKSVIDSWRVK